MNRTTQILQLISEALEIELTEDHLSVKLNELEEWDSIGWLGIIAKADELLDLELDTDGLERAETVADLVALLEHK